MSIQENPDGAATATRDHGIGACEKLHKAKWECLVAAIREGECVPILGPDFGHGIVPGKNELAQEMLAEKNEHWPLKDVPTLHRVAEFLGVKYNLLFPRKFVSDKLGKLSLPEESTAHTLLAQMPLPLYVTTYYDDLMFQALQAHPFREPEQDYMRWKTALLKEATVFDRGYVPDRKHPGRPLVFHMHGCARVPHSLVLSERDYLEFLANVSRDEKLIPSPIDQALGRSYLLFLGYSFFDFDFIILLKSLATEIEDTYLGKGNPHVAVQLADVRTPDDQERAEGFLAGYFDTLNISIFPGTCFEFVSALHAMLAAQEKAAQERAAQGEDDEEPSQ